MLNYLEQKNYFWRMYDVHSLGQAEIALYFHLLEICDKCSWTNPFKRQNTKICAHLGMSKKTLEKTRNRLQQAGLIFFDGIGKGSVNIRYEIKKAIIYSSKYSSDDPSTDTSSGSINKDLKGNLKKIAVVTCADALNFFSETKNFRSLGEKYLGPGYEEQLAGHFETFYNDKVDLGEFDNKTKQDLVKHFGNWLPIYLRVAKEEGVKGERLKAKGAAQGGESKVDAALHRHAESLKKIRQNGRNY